MSNAIRKSTNSAAHRLGDTRRSMTEKICLRVENFIPKVNFLRELLRILEILFNFAQKYENHFENIGVVNFDNCETVVIRHNYR